MAKLANLSITAMNLQMTVCGSNCVITADSIEIQEVKDVQKIGDIRITGTGQNPAEVAAAIPRSIQSNYADRSRESAQSGEAGNPGDDDSGSERRSAVVTGRLPADVGAGLSGDSEPALHVAISAPDGLVDQVADMVTDLLCKIPGFCLDKKGN